MLSFRPLPVCAYFNMELLLTTQTYKMKNTGFDISYADQLSYNIWMAEQVDKKYVFLNFNHMLRVRMVVKLPGVVAISVYGAQSAPPLVSSSVGRLVG